MNSSIRTISHGLIFGAIFSATLAVGAGSVHAALGVDFTTDVAVQGLVENGGPGTFVPGATGYTVVGWSFTPTTDLYLTRLGVYDADRDRLHSEQHQVGIWSTGTGSTLLASVSIDETLMNQPETSPNGVLFHFANVASPVMLRAGQTYVVGATLYAGDVTAGTPGDFDAFAAFNNGESPIFFNPYLTYLGNAYAINGSNQLVLPSSTFITDYTIGANIDVTPTPIPAAAWLLGSGLLGLAGVRSRKGQ